MKERRPLLSCSTAKARSRWVYGCCVSQKSNAACWVANVRYVAVTLLGGAASVEGARMLLLLLLLRPAPLETRWRLVGGSGSALLRVVVVWKRLESTLGTFAALQRSLVVAEVDENGHTTVPPNNCSGGASAQQRHFGRAIVV